jgi:hypothetical protein
MKLLPFDLEKAKNGAKVVTRSHKPARVICTDKKGARPLVALVVDDDGEISLPYFASGLYSFDKAYSPYDLFLLDETPEPTFGGRTYEIRDDGSIRFSDGENVGAEEVGELVEAWNKTWGSKWKYAKDHGGCVWRYRNRRAPGQFWSPDSHAWMSSLFQPPMFEWNYASDITRAEAAKIIGEENL